MTVDWPEDRRGALAEFLAIRGLAVPPLEVRAVTGGHSNVTCIVTDADGRRLVIRRAPDRPLPVGEHDVLREARFVWALEDTNVPVPDVLATAEAGTVLETPLFVMSFVDGTVMTTEVPPALPAAARRRAGEALVDALVSLHAVDWQEAGLRGRPSGSNRRQHERIAALIADEDGRPPAAFAAVDAWLAANVPADSGSTALHNDFRIGNVVLDERGEVRAVLDWERAAVGDPLVDLGYFLGSWATEADTATPLTARGSATRADGFPSRAELAARYAAATGRDVNDLAWYLTLAQWKLAVLYERNRRALPASGGDPYYADPAQVHAFLAAARAEAGLP